MIFGLKTELWRDKIKAGLTHETSNQSKGRSYTNRKINK